jgi:RES domain-containing protein
VKGDRDIVTVWRIVDPRYADRAYSGDGAEKFGGRFNGRGRKLVYASGSLSLALLELLVQAGRRERLAGHRCIPAGLPRDHIEVVTASDLPAGWDGRPYGRASQDFGDAWIASGRSLALQVPSVVNPFESNVLVNPLHPDFGELRIGRAVPLPLDPRLRG